MISTDSDHLKEEHNKIALAELSIKMKMEGSLRRSVRKVFSGIGKDVLKHYSATGALPDIDKYHSKIKDVLSSHYKKVSNKFDRHFRDRHDVAGINDDDIKDNLDSFIDDTTTNRAVLIHQTNKDKLKKISLAVAATALASGAVLSNRHAAIKIRRKFVADGINRANTISMTETQVPAEATKQIESSLISNNSESVDDVSSNETENQKRWEAILDGKTRTDHAIADGQVVSVDEPFLVGGEPLMYPGDPLGSVANTINCRCTAIHFVV
jgi:hypothetical protein